MAGADVLPSNHNDGMKGGINLEKLKKSGEIGRDGQI
jgi:hypothetical protein